MVVLTIILFLNTYHGKHIILGCVIDRLLAMRKTENVSTSPNNKTKKKKMLNHRVDDLKFLFL